MRRCDLRSLEIFTSEAWKAGRHFHENGNRVRSFWSAGSFSLRLLFSPPVKTFSCTCGNPLYFENSFCLKCRCEVGFDPAALEMSPLVEASPLKRCANGAAHLMACNWLVPKNGSAAYCVSCSLSHLIPNLSSANIVQLWIKMEAAKRRALFSFLSLGVPLQPLFDPNAKGAVNDKGEVVPLALSYRLLQPLPNSPVITGHDAGTITLNLEEADDALRERNRMNLKEPYRTLLGHFRHEIGHYYWSMWFENDPKRDEVLGAFRELFGDERLDYSAAMNVYYSNGPQADWQERCISAYSTMHPWEDWAETWAHYLHMIDALESFESLGLRRSAAMPKETIERIAPLPSPFQMVPVAEFTKKLQTWLELTPAINELSSSLGHNMSYPFVVSPPVIRKLFFIHCMVKRQVDAAKNWESSRSAPGKPKNVVQRIKGLVLNRQ